MTELTYEHLTPAHLDHLTMTAAHPPEKPEDCRFILDDADELMGYLAPLMFSSGVAVKWDAAIVSLETGLPVPMVSAADVEKRASAASPVTVAAPASAIQWLAHGSIVPSPLNPRTHFDPQGMADLKTSFAAHGFTLALSHLLVRPMGDRYELVCGERRWRAAGEAGISPVPAVVEHLTDVQVLELQLVENLQRQDLNPIEEAEGVCRLLDLRDESGQALYTMQTLAERLGRSMMHISRCRQLRRLRGTMAGDAVETGEISPIHGVLLARIPAGQLRDELTKRVLKPVDGFAPMPRRQLERIIHDEVMVELKSAEFDVNDETLVPVQFDEHGDRVKGGGCGDCPFNTKNAEGEKPGKFHMCTNPECFREKKAAKYARWRAEVEAEGKGRTTLPSAEVERAFDHSGKRLAFNSGYVELDEMPPEYELKQGVSNAEPWKKLIRGQGVPVVLLPDKDGMIHEVVKRDLAVQAASDAGHKIFKDAEKERRRENDEEAASRVRAEQAARELEQRLRAGRMAAVVEKAAGAKKMPEGFIELGIALLLDSTDDHGDLHEVAVRRGMAESELKNDESVRKWMEQRVAKMESQERFGMFVELLLMQAYAEPRSEAVKRAAKIFEADLKAADGKVRAEVKAEEARRAEQAEIANGVAWSSEKKGLEFEWDGNVASNPDVASLALPSGKVNALVAVAQGVKGWVVGWNIAERKKKGASSGEPCSQGGTTYTSRLLAFRTGLLAVKEQLATAYGAPPADIERVAAYLAQVESAGSKKKGAK